MILGDVQKKARWPSILMASCMVVNEMNQDLIEEQLHPRSTTVPVRPSAVEPVGCAAALLACRLGGPTSGGEIYFSN